MPTLFKSEFATLEHGVASRIVRVVRSNKQFDSAAFARAEVARWSACLESLDFSELGLLLDWRLVPLATDPDVLKEVVSGTTKFGRRFAKHAVLFVSPLGEMQARRLQRMHESDPEIFTDESKAYAYVTAR
jgi:hypothetical protein